MTCSTLATRLADQLPWWECRIIQKAIYNGLINQHHLDSSLMNKAAWTGRRETQSVAPETKWSAGIGPAIDRFSAQGCLGQSDGQRPKGVPLASGSRGQDHTDCLCPTLVHAFEGDGRHSHTTYHTAFHPATRRRPPPSVWKATQPQTSGGEERG